MNYPSFQDYLRADIRPSYKDSLMHHGIKGMHWGVRRYQNPDGSLTSEGIKRYSSNPIKRFKQKREEKRIAEEKKAFVDREYRKHLDDVENRAQKIDNEWLDRVNKYSVDKKKQAAFDDAVNKYYNDPSDSNYKKVEDMAYKYGYDYGMKAGKDLVENYGNDALNRFLDLYNHEETYYTRSIDFNTLENRDGAKRFAKTMAEYERDHL